MQITSKTTDECTELQTIQDKKIKTLLRNRCTTKIINKPDENHIFVCKICGKTMKSCSGLGSHTKRVHNLTVPEYAKKFYVNKSPDFKIESCGFCQREAFPQINIDHQREEFYFSYDQGYNCFSEQCFDEICLEYFGKPHKEAKKEFEHLGANTNYLSRRYKKSEEYVKENLKRNKDYVIPISATSSLQGYILREGVELGTQHYNERCKKIGKTLTLEWYVEKYGVQEGIKQYEDRQRNFLKSSLDIRKSMNQDKIFTALHETDFRWQPEQLLLGFVQVDMVNREKGVVIEYYGDYWHCNPRLYPEDFYNRSLKMTSLEKHKKDDSRTQKMLLLNKDIRLVIIIWENSFKTTVQDEGFDSFMSNLNEKIEDYKNLGVLWI